MDKLNTPRPTKRDESAEDGKAGFVQRALVRPFRWIVPLFEWFVFGALAFLLFRYFWEIRTSLGATNHFGPLRPLFGIVFLPIAATIILKLLQGDPSVTTSPLRRGRGITGLIILNLATAVLAIVTARAINPDYYFETPLLRFSERLLRQFLT